MVYFKVNALLDKLMKLARLQQSFVGCSPLCDRQLISVQDMQMCLRAVKQEIEELEQLLKGPEPVEESKAVVTEIKDDKQREVARIIEQNMEQFRQLNLRHSANEEAAKLRQRKRLDELLQFKSLTTEEISKKSEIVMSRQHICNNNLKVDSSTKKDAFMIWKHPNPAVKQEFKIRKCKDVIDFHQSCLLTLDEINARNVESAANEKLRLESNAKNLTQIKNSLARKEYDKLVGGIAGFENRSALLKREEIADFRFMMAFGFGFITVMFLGFLTGYCIGKFLLEWNDNDSLLLALATGIPTLFLEAVLMMIRLNKWEKKREAERKKQNRSAGIVIRDEVIQPEAAVKAKPEGKSKKTKQGKGKTKIE